MKKAKYLILIMIGVILLSGCSLLPRFSVRNTIWYARDNSEMVFGDQGTFAWYRNESNHDDNYYKGTYKLYVGENARNHIVNDLEKFGVTREELDGLISRNSDYLLENLIVFDLTYTDYKYLGRDMLNGETRETSWYGFLLKDGTYMSVADMSTANTYGFTKKES